MKCSCCSLSSNVWNCGHFDNSTYCMCERQLRLSDYQLRPWWYYTGMLSDCQSRPWWYYTGMLSDCQSRPWWYYTGMLSDCQSRPWWYYTGMLLDAGMLLLEPHYPLGP